MGHTGEVNMYIRAQRHRQQGDLISLLLFLENKESRLKIKNNETTCKDKRESSHGLSIEMNGELYAPAVLL
jgi:hypothetical protein